MKTIATVENNDREISLQFSFTSLSAIPQFLEDLSEETLEKFEARQQLGRGGSSGEDLTDGGQFRGKMVDLGRLPAGLIKTDYVLIGVWKQQRVSTNPGPLQNCPYWMIRFRFRHHNYLSEYISRIGDQAWKEIEGKRPRWLGELVTICSLAFWQMRAWRNPWFQAGKPVPGASCISLNFEGRKPLYEWDPPVDPKNDDDLPAQHKPDAIFSID
jgi:hypothetical protein